MKSPSEELHIGNEEMGGQRAAHLVEWILIVIITSFSLLLSEGLRMRILSEGYYYVPKMRTGKPVDMNRVQLVPHRSTCGIPLFLGRMGKAAADPVAVKAEGRWGTLFPRALALGLSPTSLLSGAPSWQGTVTRASLRTSVVGITFFRTL